MKATTYIREIVTRVHIGCCEKESATPQPIAINVEVDSDPTLAVKHDRPEHAIDYRQVHQIVMNLADSCRFQLVETLAHAIAVNVIELPGALAVTVDIRKPHRFENADAAGSRLRLEK